MPTDIVMVCTEENKKFFQLGTKTLGFDYLFLGQNGLKSKNMLNKPHFWWIKG